MVSSPSLPSTPSESVVPDAQVMSSALAVPSGEHCANATGTTPIVSMRMNRACRKCRFDMNGGTPKLQNASLGQEFAVTLQRKLGVNLTYEIILGYLHFCE